MAEIEILEVRQILSAEKERLGKADTLVIYEKDKKKRGFVVIPLDKPTEKQVLDAIAATEKQQSAMVGKSFKID